MAASILESKGFAREVIDALSSHICVIDTQGAIVAVNRAWRNFMDSNPPAAKHAGVGANYLKTCRDASGPGSEGADEFAAGIEAVLEGKTDLFQMEYPCHSPTEYRWFLGDVTAMDGEIRGAVISHMTITARKLLELELKKLAATDALTGLPNRRYFLDAANAEAERVRRFGVPASLVMIDLDHFKVVNDTYGHAAGDEALRGFAKTCTRLLRHIDILARLGGEEFALLLPGTDEFGAASVVEKLRQAVQDITVVEGRNRFHFSASFGVAQMEARDEGAQDCLARADKALFAAKQAGRNRVMRYAQAAKASPE